MPLKAEQRQISAQVSCSEAVRVYTSLAGISVQSRSWLLQAGWRDCVQMPFCFMIQRKEKHSHSRTEQPLGVLRENTQSHTTTQDSWPLPSALLLVSSAMLLG